MGRVNKTMALLQQVSLFVSGVGGYIRYRIPALVISQRGTILAFCEARQHTGRASDQIDLLLRRSDDGGRTFAPLQIVAHEEGWVCGNPAPVLDRDTGTIWLLFCKNRKEDRERHIVRGGLPRTVWATHSQDDGATWAEPVEITAAVKRPEWAWYATGPGHGIQLQSGRLLIPCDHSLTSPDEEADAPYFAHVIYSDDHGHTWALGGSTVEGANESTAVETVDGRVYLNSRNALSSLLERSGGSRSEDQPYFRAYAWSSDGGNTFSIVRPDRALPEPICQASVCRLTDERRHDRNRVLFVNPASRKRENLTIRLSYDECRTWPVSRTLFPGKAGYSDLCVTEDLTVGCLYEEGADNAFETLTFTRFNLNWLTGNNSEQET